MTVIQKCKRPLLAVAMAALFGTGAAQAYDTCLPCQQKSQPVIVKRTVVRPVKRTRVVRRVVVNDPCDPCDPCATTTIICPDPCDPCATTTYVRRDPCAPCGQITVSPSLYSEPVVIRRTSPRISVPANTYSCSTCPY